MPRGLAFVDKVPATCAAAHKVHHFGRMGAVFGWDPRMDFYIKVECDYFQICPPFSKGVSVRSSISGTGFTYQTFVLKIVFECIYVSFLAL